MVMPNRHDGANSPGWWDDLPPGVKRRISPPDADSGDPAAARGHDPAHRPYRPAVVADLSRLAILFLIVAIANVLFLMLALSFLAGHGPFTP